MISMYHDGYARLPFVGRSCIRERTLDRGGHLNLGGGPMLRGIYGEGNGRVGFAVAVVGVTIIWVFDGVWP